MIDNTNKYTVMQKNQYDDDASKWTVEERDHVVGNFDNHNNWKDYEYLFKKLKTEGKVALDFGCGPGRNIVKYWDQFKRIDGVDISEKNLDNARLWVNHNNLDSSKINLIHCNGVDLSNIDNDTYDFVFSTICLQHICVHEIRLNYFKEFHRILNKKGWFTAQMGFGLGHPRSVAYHDNNYEAMGTNSLCDTRIENPDNLQNDLESIGFKNFEYYVRPVGPGDGHGYWIFFRAQK